MNGISLTYIGGPTALIDWQGLRFLTDPTFDPAESEYKSGPATLKKLAGPAISAESLDTIDAVLLSHDHHSDNLDRTGRQFLSHAKQVITTTAGAERLGRNARGLERWQTIEILAPAGGMLTITGTPCRHGPADMDRGPVIGFALKWSEDPDKALYVSGDTVWYEGVAEVAKRFHVTTALLFMGAARVPEITPSPLTMTAIDAVAAAQAFADATIVPLHYEGWAHFSESREVISAAFAAAGIADRLRWVEPGEKTIVQN